MNDKPVALITGASRGIGAATALRFAKDGYRVTLVARTRSDLENVAKQAEEAGSEALVCAGDLVDLDFAKSAIDQTVNRFRRIDVLVNNAAWREIKTMRQISVESWEKTIRISLTTPAFMARWAAESMEKQKEGVIINISSVMSRQAAGTAPAYIAVKGALESLTCELASLYGPSGIRVVTISPGAVDTEMGQDITPTPDHADRLRQYSEDMIMLRRWAQPEEIANLIVAVAGEAGTYVTGTTILADGGWNTQHLPLSLRHQQNPDQF